MNETLTTHDVFMRYTDPQGKPWVYCHRVWDGPRFIAARHEEAKRLAQKSGGKETATQITEEQYLKERRK